MTGSGRWTWPQRLAVAACAAFSAVFVVRTAFSFDGQRVYSLFDDAMISMRYARNLVDGHGLRWNEAGPAVEGYTNLLWTLWMAALHLVGLPSRLVSAAVAASGGALLVGNLVLVRAIVRRVAPAATHLPAVAMWLVAAYYPLAYWTLRGMEVGLVATLTSAAILLALRVHDGGGARDVGLLCVVLGACVLTRPDALVIALVVAGWLVAVVERGRRKAIALACGGTLVGVLTAVTLFRLAYYGEALPNTYYLKLSGIELGTRLRRGVGGLVTMGTMELYAPVVVAAVYLGWARRRAAAPLVLLAALFGAQCAYSAWVGGDAWEGVQIGNRYLASGATAVLVLAVLAADRVLSAPPDRRRRLLMACAGGALVVLAIRAADWRPASSMQLGRLPTEWWLPRLGLPALVVAVFLFLRSLPLSERARPADRLRVSRTAALVVVVVAAALSMSARELSVWVRYNSFLRQDTDSALLGLSLRDATGPGTTVAVFAAGGSAYFSRRPMVDMGGKSDAVIARQAPALPVFVPGHDKFDFGHSVGRLRPDVVIAGWLATPSAQLAFREWGYEEVTPSIWIRRGVTTVDRSLLASASRFAG